MRISKIVLRFILNSRAEKTFEVFLKSGNLLSRASAPSGKSKSKKEAEDVDCDLALKRFKKIETKLGQKDFLNQRDFDNFLNKQKNYLGVNLILSLSIAFTRLLAKKQRIPLWKYLRGFNSKNPVGVNGVKFPFFFFNLINAGVHAPFGPLIQEYLIVPLKKPTQSLKITQTFFKELKRSAPGPLGDEGGLVIKQTDPEFPLFLFEKTRKKLGLTFKDVRYSLDCAANTFYHKDKKFYSGLPKMYSYFISKYRLFSLEDPFEENDLDGFKKFYKEFSKKTLIIGDDLTSTNPFYIKKYKQEKLINAVLTKPDQAGTVSGTIKALKTAEQNRLKIIVSHRSAETNDSFIADLCFAFFCFGLKSGAPLSKQRKVKYNRIIEIINY